ncbi:MAG: hypothetical protein H0U95_02135 [Bacteroidetes bacterium]|nr:hypothetical protein [Bacteroidota bacterium]
METTIISIITGSTTGVLKEIRENNIHHTYLGIDQNNQLLMQLSYNEENKKIIEGIHSYIREMEIFINEFNTITAPLMEQAKKEQEKSFKEFKEKQLEFKKRRDKIKKSKQTEIIN